MYNDDFLDKKLDDRKTRNAFRRLHISSGRIDFCSNDYLGIVKNNILKDFSGDSNRYKTGATGSRLLSGNYQLIEQVEKQISVFHQTESALVFNSGYDANVGVLSALPQKGDTVIYDFLSHASIRDGIRLSHARSFSFAHNDLNDLEKKLQNATGNIFVVTESVFSMDGDMCPLQQLTDICRRYNVNLVIDEAHATGVVGEKGEGLVQALQLQSEIFCRIHTFGKACGCHGAVALGSEKMRHYLINFARSFIYSTALPEHSVATIKRSYECFPYMVHERQRLRELIVLFQEADIPYRKLISQTPIQIIVVPGNDPVKELAGRLQVAGFDVRPVLYPTVPEGKERLRIILHAFNTKEEVENMINELQKFC